ncbi:hypothetical protein [Hymenobacter nivis]|uniref:hypothetical protein n=1 Tax=Hymenobacter nivis TaxID=1850093 RepID=UPI00319E4DB8
MRAQVRRQARALGQPWSAEAQQYRAILRTHLVAARQANSLPELLKRGGLAALTLVMLGALVYGLNRFFRIINQRILRWHGSPLRSWRINGYELLTQERQLEVLRTVLKLLRLALVVLTLYLALPLLFGLFPWTEGISRKLLGYVLGPVQGVVLGVVHYVPNLLTILVIYFFTTYAVCFLRFLAGEVAAGKLVVEGFYPDPTGRCRRSTCCGLRCTCTCSSSSSPTCWAPIRRCFRACRCCWASSFPLARPRPSATSSPASSSPTCGPAGWATG